MILSLLQVRKRFEKEEAFQAVLLESERVRLYKEWMETYKTKKKKEKKKHKKRSGSVIFIHSRKNSTTCLFFRCVTVHKGFELTELLESCLIYFPFCFSEIKHPLEEKINTCEKKITKSQNFRQFSLSRRGEKFHSDE